MEPTRAYALHARQQGGQDPSAMAYDTTVIVFGIFGICLVAMAPMVWMLVWMRNDDNHDSIRRRLQRQDGLPTTTNFERPAQEILAKPRLSAGKVRLVVSRLRGGAVAAGRAVASRSEQAYLGLWGFLASSTSLRRRNTGNKTRTAAESVYDLPIMRKPAWQRLAESYTSGTLSRSRKVVGEEQEEDSEEGARAHDDDAKVESKAGTSGSSGGGSEVGAVAVEVQKPKAVLAVSWAA